MFRQRINQYGTNYGNPDVCICFFFSANGPAMDLTGMKEVWTEWLNFDTYTGTGDYENVKYWCK